MLGLSAVPGVLVWILLVSAAVALIGYLIARAFSKQQGRNPSL